VVAGRESEGVVRIREKVLLVMCCVWIIVCWSLFGWWQAGASTDRHQDAVHHAQMVLHAERVHHAHRLHAIELRGAGGLRSVGGGGIWRDWYETNTRDWRCIRTGESGGNYSDYSGAYGILAGWDVGTLSHRAQDAWALYIMHNHGWRAWSTSPGCGL
jgi:hypothetical protein